MNKEEFKKARKKLKYTQLSFAEELGISQRTVTGYEVGTAKIPKAIMVFVKQLLKEALLVKNGEPALIDVSDKETLTIKEVARICIENKDALIQEPEIKMWFDLIRNEARAELMERHVILREGVDN